MHYAPARYGAHPAYRYGAHPGYGRAQPGYGYYGGYAYPDPSLGMIPGIPNPLSIARRFLPNITNIPGLPTMPNPLDPIGSIFAAVVATNIASSSGISIPGDWRSKLVAFSRARPTDGAMLLPGLARLPSFRRGGWIMQVQPNAAAMTLDKHVFVTGRLSLATYVHEMVHVTQYGILGPTAFLTSYFGLSAATIAYRFIRRQPINAMQSSPHENQAYALEQRFVTWHRATYAGVDPNTITV